MKIAMTVTNQPVELKDDGTWQYLKPSGSALEKLRGLEQPADVVLLFKDMFDRVGLQILDSDERFTCIHKGNKITFEDGIDEDSVDFCVSIYSYQIDRFIADVKIGYKDPLSHFRLAREFFRFPQHGGKSLLNNPILTNSTFRKLIHSKNLLHNKDEESDATYTVFFVNGSWNLASGLVGDPERVFRLSVDDALELNRHIFTASRDTKLTDMPKLAKWYVDWRDRVEVKAA
jgi:hypothetical protein